MPNLRGAGTLLSLFALFAGSAWPQSPGVSPAPAQDYTHEPFVVEQLQTDIRFEADGRGSRETKLRVRIQSESAVRQFGLLVYPFMASFESLDVVYARVRKPDGTVIDTPASEIQELDSAVSREAPMYTDQREKHIAVKALSVGDTLEVDLRWDVHDPVAPGHFWYDHSFFNDGICLSETLEFNLPADVPVKLAAAKFTPEIKQEGSRRIYIFHSSHLEKKSSNDAGSENEIPSWEKNVHGLDPPPIRLSSFTSWAEVGAWYGGLEQSRVEVTPRIRSTAEEITKGESTDDGKMHALYDYVSSRFRYIGIDLGYGRYTPHAAEDVLANRYGDCKDKHTLFAALLQAVGVHAYAALIGSTYHQDPDFPSPSLFDHVITAVPHGDAVTFLDTTPEVAPYGLLLAGLRDRRALVIPPNAPARLVKTPAAPPFPSRETFQIDGSIDIKGVLDGEAKMADHNDAEVLLRAAFRNTPQNSWTDLTQALVARMGFGGTVSDVSAAQPEKTGEPFWVAYRYHRKDYSDWEHHRITLPFPPVFLPLLNEAQKRSTEPLPLGSPQEIDYETSLKLPEGIQPALPPDAEIKRDFADYTATYRFANGTIVGARRLKIKLPEVPGAERGEYSDFVKFIGEEVGQWIFLGGDFERASPLRKAQGLLNEGNPTDAVALLEKAITQDPDDKKLRLMLGRAYLRLDIDVKAAGQFQKLLEGEPSAATLSTVAHEYLNANRRVREAADYAARAVAMTSVDTMKVSLSSAQTDDYLRMTELANGWDTLGWAKFLTGDAAGAEKYIFAAWKLWQRANIGEHLAEVYERLGRKHEAEYICSLALAAPGLDDEFNLRGKLLELRGRLNAGGPQHDEAQSRDHRISPAEISLSEMRELKVPRKMAMRRSSSAIYTVAIETGKRPAEVRFVSGSQSLDAEAPALAAAKFDQPLPDATPVRILRAGWFSCSEYSEYCTMVFFQADDKPSFDAVAKKSD